MTDLRPASSNTVRVLGIDPGTRVLGYGVIDAERGRAPKLIDCGVVRLPTSPLCERLETIFRRVEEVIRRHKPRVLAIEEVFHGKNFQSVLKVGEARGVVVLAAQRAGLEIHEYSPARIKKAATGNGNADKSQVQSMMARRLGLDVPPEPQDVTDALAAAFCHSERRWRLVPESRPRRKRGVPASKRRPRPATAAEKEPVTEKRAVSDTRAVKETDGALLKALLGSGRARVLATGRFRPRRARGAKPGGGRGADG